MDLKPMFLPILLSVALGPSLTESACSARLDDKVLGYIFSPTNKNTPLMSTSALDTSHGDYPDNSDCTYTIRTPPGTIVKLSWITFDVKGYMPTCWPKDYVEIFVGCDKKTIGKYCDSNSGSPFDMYSADNCMEIKFYSDGSDHGTGFMAKFEAFNAKQALLSSSTTRCSLSKYGSSGLSTLKGTIATTNWPLPYPVTGDSCYWRFGSSASSKGYKIAIMDFDTQYDFGCDDTKVKIKGDNSYTNYDKADYTIKDSMCGSKSPTSFTTTQKYVYIRFKSDYSNIGKRGFVIGYVQYEQSIHDTATQITGVVVGVIIAIIVVGCLVFFCVIRRRRLARGRPPPVAVQQGQPLVVPPPGSYPTQPQTGYPAQGGYPMQPQGQMPPPPSYGQATAGQYPQPGGYYPPPGEQPYPPPGVQPYPPPGGHPYPPPQGGPAPYPGGSPYPPPGGNAPPYSAPDQQAVPYPTKDQPPYPTQ